MLNYLKCKYATSFYDQQDGDRIGTVCLELIEFYIA